ncbi:hypothetical protein UO65_0422 [Actinokineospora spheciospongiae]|uniref:Uncharacterized protein n=1 Tax=Actinokineospora spheciospongiae TaxID=909613 RepID=W7JE97_9PSEU|nr:hypothetical protein UO65_0422 [Actinokineospora spheciospongiae]
MHLYRAEDAERRGRFGSRRRVDRAPPPSPVIEQRADCNHG